MMLVRWVAECSLAYAMRLHAINSEARVFGASVINWTRQECSFCRLWSKSRGNALHRYEAYDNVID